MPSMEVRGAQLLHSLRDQTPPLCDPWYSEVSHFPRSRGASVRILKVPSEQEYSRVVPIFGGAASHFV